ncbi:SpoIID/LytB domain-containing protein [Ruminococcus sp.]|uniref:SpoIID/LytB domain-containing protein n=1 Tax=Ruminococcus sp. TaxID=41978 RepID=UPI0025EAEE28|nr:SpoIID/LytB domain-containing protein [Ruminococcus sp.]MBQ8967333.1 SpoIID/LytB domain-containing protein [Ruminococcus sp.]
MNRTTNERPSKAKRIAAHLRLLVTGIAVTGGCGLMMLTDSAFNPAKQVEKQQPVRAAAEVVSKEVEIKNARINKASASALAMVQREFSSDLVLPEPTMQKMEFPKFKKAAIGEYDVSAAETKSKGVKVNSAEITDPNDFTVPFPEQDTLIYYPEKNAPMNLTATRSVAGEYFRVHDENSGSTLVLNGHELLCLMVNNEIGDSWDENAIKAQIVAAYSHLRFNQEHGLTPTIGLRYGYSSKLEGCVNAVEGQAMHYDGQVINAVYSASSAGYTTTAGDIWGMDYPYLKCVESIYDDQDVNWGIEKKYSRAEVKNMLESRFGIALSEDQTKWFTIDRAYSVVYIDTVTIDGRENCKLTGNQLCNMMGLKSNAITIKYKDGEFTFTSCGWGHGVGMSQWGAHYYAENGWTYDQILTHYYVDAKLELSQPAANSAAAPEEDTSSDSSEAEYTEPVVTEAPAQTDHSDYGDQSAYTDNTQQWTETAPPVQEWTPEPETQWQPDDQWSADTGYSDYSSGYSDYSSGYSEW